MLQAALQAMHSSHTSLGLPAVGLWMVDASLRFTSVAGFTGGPAWLGRTLADIVAAHPERQTIMDAHERALGGEAVTYDVVWDGTPRRVRLTPIPDDRDGVAGITGVAFAPDSETVVDEVPLPAGEVTINAILTVAVPEIGAEPGDRIVFRPREQDPHARCGFFRSGIPPELVVPLLETGGLTVSYAEPSSLLPSAMRMLLRLYGRLRQPLALVR